MAGNKNLNRLKVVLMTVRQKANESINKLGIVPVSL